MKLLPVVAGAAAGIYTMFFSEMAERRHAQELMSQGITPACVAPQVEERAKQVLRRSWASDAEVSVTQQVSARFNQRSCWAKLSSESQGIVVGHAEFSIEFDSEMRILFVIFEKNSQAFEKHPLK